MLAGGRSGRAVCPSWGVPAGTAVLPARRSRPHHVFCVRFGLRFGLKVGTQKEGENIIYSLDSAYYYYFLPELHLQAVNTVFDLLLCAELYNTA